MTDRVKGSAKQGYWFTKNDAIMVGLGLTVPNWNPNDDIDAEGNFLPGTTAANVIELMQTYGTIVWLDTWGCAVNNRLHFLFEGHSFDVDANGGLTASQRTEIKNLIESVVTGHTCTVRTESGGWYSSIRCIADGWPLGTGLIADITSHS